MTTTRIAPRQLARALAYVRQGGRLCVRTALRCTVIDAKTLAKWEAAKLPFLREEGESYRMARGRSSVYLLPGQLEAINEDGFHFA